MYINVPHPHEFLLSSSLSLSRSSVQETEPVAYRLNLIYINCSLPYSKHIIHLLMNVYKQFRKAVLGTADRLWGLEIPLCCHQPCSFSVHSTVSTSISISSLFLISYRTENLSFLYSWLICMLTTPLSMKLSQGLSSFSAHISFSFTLFFKLQNSIFIPPHQPPFCAFTIPHQRIS